MGRLAELMQLGPGPAPIDPMQEWCDTPYVQLSAVLANLRYLALLHQTHHWIAKGDPFYGDHLLFEKMYQTVIEEIDDVAEKAVGKGGEQTVSMEIQAKLLLQLVQQDHASQVVPTGTQLAEKSYHAELDFIKTTEHLLNSLCEAGLASDGIKNMLQGICDVHERHVYLLKRRSQFRA